MPGREEEIQSYINQAALFTNVLSQLSVNETITIDGKALAGLISLIDQGARLVGINSE